jgi:predicted nuclease of predicted toxin-antitoxin system
MQGAPDEQIIVRAAEENRIVVPADSDFSAILAAQEAEHPSFVLFREPDLTAASDYLRAMLPALSAIEFELASGCVAVFRRGRLRVRPLPFST